ncbi:MAG: hypothetical protein ABIG46_03215 [Candidatus Omnitrophota bacterium]|nr:hypothetical protein [Candidatus Omnitrophota bacterium]
MKNSVLIVTLVIVALILGLAIFSSWKYKDNANLRLVLKGKKEELKKTEATSRKVEELKKQSQELKRSEEKIYTMVPVGQEKPFKLIKEISLLAASLGLKSLEFNLPSENGQDENKDVSLGGSVNSAGSSQPQGHAPGADVSLGGANPNPRVNLSKDAPKPIVIEMSCQATLDVLVNFLNKVGNLERLVNIQKMVIERDGEILPFQKISLELITYYY